MRCFLLGGHISNGGPDNVNRSLIESSNGEFLCIKCTNKFLRVLESFWKIFVSEQVLVSGVCAPRYYDFLKLLHKKYSYLMHGCIEFENELNKLHLSEKTIESERKVLEGAEHIICVSEGYAEWVRQHYPEYVNKITYVNNGIELEQRRKIEKEPFSVAVSGGNRCIKNNLEVSRTVRKLNEAGTPCKLYIFGRKYPDNEEIEETDYITYCGHLDKKPYYDKLDAISCYVLNSEVEPFGLVAADALNCNCSLLMSKNVGAKSIMRTEDTDIILNPHNVDEIIEKLQYLFEHPNSDRLYRSIDRQDCSEETAFQKIKAILEDKVK